VDDDAKAKVQKRLNVSPTKTSKVKTPGDQIKVHGFPEVAHFNGFRHFLSIPLEISGNRMISRRFCGFAQNPEEII
jgi:hypothetical protein